MIECSKDEIIEFYQPLPQWLLEPLTSGTFTNGMSKVGYLRTEAIEIEQYLRLGPQEGA